MWKQSGKELFGMMLNSIFKNIKSSAFLKLYSIVLPIRDFSLLEFVFTRKNSGQIMKTIKTISKDNTT